jgi:hypothetical protein
VKGKVVNILEKKKKSEIIFITIGLEKISQNGTKNQLLVEREKVSKLDYIKLNFCWVPVAHTCNSSYSGGKDQEDCGLKPAWAKSL